MSPTTPIYSEKSKESLTYTSPLPVSLKKSRQEQFLENLFGKITTPSLDMESPEQPTLSNRNIQTDMSLLPHPRIKPNYSQNYYAEIELNPRSTPTAPTIGTPRLEELPAQNNSPEEDYRRANKEGDTTCNEHNYSDYSAQDSPTGEEVYSETQFPMSPNNVDDFYEIDLGNRTERFNAFKKHVYQLVDQDQTIDPYMKTCLKTFIENDCSETIEEQKNLAQIIAQEIDVTKKDSKGNTILHIAIESQFIEVIQYLQCHRDIQELGLFNEENANGDTPLHLAVKEKFAEGVDILAYYAESLEAKNSITGDTALLMAIKSGFVEGIKILMSYGANRNEPNSQTGLSPWDYLQLHHDGGTSEDEEIISAFLN